MPDTLTAMAILDLENIIKAAKTLRSSNKITPQIIEEIKKENAKIIIYTRETFSKRPYPRDKNFYSYYSQNTPIRLSNFLKLKALNKRGT